MPEYNPFEALQNSLDAFSQTPGALLYRAEDGWRALEPGNLGDVLTIDLDGMPSWQPPSP